MENYSRKICRLCLDNREDEAEDFHITINEIFNLCLPELDLSISYNYTLCHGCLHILKEFYLFKIKCLQTEEKLRLNMENANPEHVDLKQIAMCDTNRIGVTEICRSCLSLVDKFEHIQIDVINGDLILKNMFTACIPEMDFHLSKDPVLCYICIDNIKRFYSFKSRCLQIEQEIIAHRFDDETKLVNSSGFVKLGQESSSKSDENINSTECMEKKDLKYANVIKNEEPCELSLHTQSDSINDKQNKSEGMRKFNSEFDAIVENRFDFVSCGSEDHYLPIRLQILSQNAMNPPTEILKWYKCEICSYETHWKSHLNRHSRIHQDSYQDNKFFNCVKCGFTSKYKHSLLRHSTLEHGDWLKCGDCEYQTKWKRCFNQHVLSHNSRWHNCELCSYKTKWKSHLKRHMVTHQ